MSEPTNIKHIFYVAIGALSVTVMMLAGLVDASKHFEVMPRVGKEPIPGWSNRPGNNVGIGFHFMPPEIFQRDTNAVIQTVRPDEIALYCSPGAAACATKRGEHPIIIMPNPCEYVVMPNGQRDPYASILCHELGHTNGWSHEGNDRPDILSCDRWPAAFDSLQACEEMHQDAREIDPRWCEGPLTKKGERLCTIRERFYS